MPYRLSPFVSGGVYVAYDVLIITTIPRDADEERNSLRNSRWPNNWRGSKIGRAGLVVVGIAFIAATIVQLEQFVTKSFHNTIKEKFWKMPAVMPLFLPGLPSHRLSTEPSVLWPSCCFSRTQSPKQHPRLCIAEMSHIVLFSQSHKSMP